MQPYGFTWLGELSFLALSKQNSTEIVETETALHIIINAISIQLLNIYTVSQKSGPPAPGDGNNFGKTCWWSTFWGQCTTNFKVKVMLRNIFTINKNDRLL